MALQLGMHCLLWMDESEVDQWGVGDRHRRRRRRAFSLSDGFACGGRLRLARSLSRAGGARGTAPCNGVGARWWEAGRYRGD